MLHKALEKEEKTSQKTEKPENISQKSAIVEQPKPEVKITQQPLGMSKSSGLSIKKYIENSEKEEEITVEIEEDLPQNPFTEEILQAEWQRFLQRLAIENTLVFSAINAFELHKIGEGEIEVSYSSDTAKKEFESIENEFFGPFKQKVNHYKIMVSYKKNEALKREFLTKRKIFENLAEINPLLKDLETLMKFDFN